MKRKGFTLVNVIITIVIISILAAIAIPILIRALQTGREVEVRGELGSLHRAISMFYLDKGRFPKNSTELEEYISIPNIDDKYELNPDLP